MTNQARLSYNWLMNLIQRVRSALPRIRTWLDRDLFPEDKPKSGPIWWFILIALVVIAIEIYAKNVGG